MASQQCYRIDNPITHLYQWQKHGGQLCDGDICNSEKNKKVASDWIEKYGKVKFGSKFNCKLDNIACGNPQLRNEDWIKEGFGPDGGARSEGRVRGD